MCLTECVANRCTPGVSNYQLEMQRLALSLELRNLRQRMTNSSTAMMTHSRMTRETARNSAETSLNVSPSCPGLQLRRVNDVSLSLQLNSPDHLDTQPFSTGCVKIKRPNTKTAISQECVNIFAPNFARLFSI